MSVRVYLAGPLFSDAERHFNAGLASILEGECSVYLPQRDGCLVVDLVENFQIPWNEAAQEVFDRDQEAIEKCDLLIAVMDGRAVDEGAAFEMGYAFARGKPCWALKTDPRTLLKYGDNPMLLGALDRIFYNVDDLVEAVRQWQLADHKPQGA